MSVPQRFPRRAAARARTRERILEAAAGAFERAGYADTTTAAIAEAAEIHPATLFAHFPAKRDIAAALAERAIAGLEAALAGSGPFIDRWAAVVRAAAAAHAARGRRDFLARDLASDPALLPVWLNYERAQAAVFARELARERGATDADPTVRLAAATLAAAGLLIHDAWAGGADMVTEAEAVIGAARRQLSPPQPLSPPQHLAA